MVYLIFIAGLVLFAMLFSLAYRKHMAGFKPKNKQLNYQNSVDLIEVQKRKISSRPFLFGIEDHIVSDEDMYFDDNSFYAIDTKQMRQVVFPLADIIELSKTSTIINNRNVWQVIFRTADDNKMVFKFTHNYTIWNKDFYEFYKRVKQTNPTVVKSKWSLWNM